ncbi:signal peptide peptidase SppA [Thermosediminibacter oceani]|uniref:Signal peptide peptidase A n=1 Tax=Thermosediminibacter oceani (strain ATCC BAA-1034 / DSM 16646 / JW/IW-1228P) TaxID=555079 RepID=D9S0N1_THEOJ|nr:signal peptide peptidase SppA [Thermosediminibacter oceani]ADL08889.1 signal peptide peptidase A [Thermosediminibacter oceani DSM 16646]
MKQNKRLITIALIVLVIASVIAAFALGPGREEGSTAAEDNMVGVINLEGVITGGSGDAFLSSGSDHIVHQLHEASQDPSIKALVIRINSPGGSAAASQEIYQEVLKVKEAGKKVVVSMGDVAASGGYWVASAADKIVANPATITGSIGVIMEFQNVEGLFEKLGLKVNVIKSAEHKDIGSPTRPMTEEERAIFQGMVDDIYNQFIDVVAKGRKMDREKVKELADGRIFTGRQAKELGLVDELGNFYDALKIAAELAGIEGEPEIKEYGRKTPLEILMTGAPGLLQSRNIILPWGIDPAGLLRAPEMK